jgi:hypothetical protein
MLYLDTAILNLIERACRRFQQWTGRTNVWLAVQLTNLSIIVYFLWAAAYFWNVELWLRVFVAIFCTGVLYVLMQTLFKEPIETYENNAFRRVLKGARNPRRVRDQLLRISFLTLAVGYPAVFLYTALPDARPIQGPLVLTYSLILLTTVVLYLLACDPLPPSPEKLKEGVKEGVRARVPAHEV